MGRVVQSIFKPQIPQPAPAPPPPSPVSSSSPVAAKETQEAQNRASEEEARRMGRSRAATILTSAETQGQAPSVSKRVLLGA